MQKLTIDELIGNLKTYEMKKKKDNERREPKKEKNLVFKADNSDSSGDNADMDYLTRRFQKMVRRNGGIPKREALAEQKAMIDVTNAGSQDISSNIFLFTSRTITRRFSGSEGDDEQGDTSMMAVESEITKFEVLFSKEAAVKGSSQRWYVDRGCSTHMTGSTDDLLLLKALQGGSVSLGNGKKGYILGVGKIGKTLTHSIENVYYVNGLKYNMLSVSQICDKGNKLKFLSNSCTVTNLVTGEVVLVEKRFKYIYVADFQSLNSGANKT
ncbi:uncharacterized protein [Nicotiana tomentosiformis]|uniref:uncharacterized protein n=1 Tax=Nicotiana tomentosiformis TaxID=4098 RepID=UPI00388C58D5